MAFICYVYHHILPNAHILQPLDVRVFKSFKTNFSKACRKYLVKHPGRVVTTEALASLVAEAWPSVFIAVNIMAGFKKTGTYPLNPGEVTDRQLATSKGFCPKSTASSSNTGKVETPLFLKEQETLYKRRFEEKYDVINDPDYLAWVKINHPELDVSSAEVSSSVSSDHPHSTISTKSSDVLSQILVLPEPIKTKATCKRQKLLIVKKQFVLARMMFYKN